MTLSGAFQIGRSALTAAQVAIQVTGNNVSNAATPGYSRQTLSLAGAQDQRFGNNFIGRGVDVLSIRRQADDALQSRLWSSISNQSRAASDSTLLANVETSLNALDPDASLSARVNSFFNSWSNLADNPTASGNRALVVQSGRQLSAAVRDLRSDLVGQRDQVDRTLATAAGRANDLLGQLANLNTQIVTAEGGQGQASSLRDQRDVIIGQLAEYLDVTPIPQANGGIDLLVGSTPVVLAGRSRGVELRIRTENGVTHAALVTGDNKEVLPVTSGQVGSLLAQRDTLVNDTITRLDEIATNLIAQVNRAHALGHPSGPLTAANGTLGLRTSDQNTPINDPANLTFAGLPGAIRPTAGEIHITVRNTATGATETVALRVDLDGIDNSFAHSTADDTTPEALRASINGISNLSATFSPEGKLQINAASGYQFTIDSDTSGAVAAFGINTYFSGTSAQNIAVRDELIADPNGLAAGGTDKDNPTSNAAALAIAQLRSKPLDALGGVTLNDRWDQAVQGVAVKASAARTSSLATQTVRENLDAQRSSLAGVSLDEEAINLLNYQRQYQAAARYITAVDEMTQTLLQIAR
ncbi:flagellar hook-associated protein FlgK [soil metagenome]